MVTSPVITNKEHSTLELKLKCNSQGKTIVSHQYETHPMRVSRIFRLDRGNDTRAYIYLRNNSPGLLGEDELSLALNLAKDTQLYLTEQSATKVHPMKQGVVATVNYQWQIGENSIVEFVPEPTILYCDSALRQTTKIEIHPTASLFFCDRLLPGRLARGESYQFNYYDRSLEVYSSSGKLWFRDRMYLTGKENPYAKGKLFASLPIMGSAIVIMPNVEIDLLKNTLDSSVDNNTDDFIAAISILPYEKGVSIRVLASKTQKIANYWHCVLNSLRKLNRQSPLPKVPK